MRPARNHMNALRSRGPVRKGTELAPSPVGWLCPPGGAPNARLLPKGTNQYTWPGYLIALMLARMPSALISFA